MNWAPESTPSRPKTRLISDLKKPFFFPFLLGLDFLENWAWLDLRGENGRNRSFVRVALTKLPASEKFYKEGIGFYNFYWMSMCLPPAPQRVLPLFFERNPVSPGFSPFLFPSQCVCFGNFYQFPFNRKWKTIQLCCVSIGMSPNFIHLRKKMTMWMYQKDSRCWACKEQQQQHPYVTEATFVYFFSNYI